MKTIVNYNKKDKPKIDRNKVQLLKYNNSDKNDLFYHERDVETIVLHIGENNSIKDTFNGVILKTNSEFHSNGEFIENFMYEFFDPFDGEVILSND